MKFAFNRRGTHKYMHVERRWMLYKVVAEHAPVYILFWFSSWNFQYISTICLPVYYWFQCCLKYSLPLTLQQGSSPLRKRSVYEYLIHQPYFICFLVLERGCSESVIGRWVASYYIDFGGEKKKLKTLYAIDSFSLSPLSCLKF